MSSERSIKNYLITSKMNRKKKIRLITEYLLNEDAEDKNKIVGMMIAEVLISPFVETYGNISNFVLTSNQVG